MSPAEVLIVEDDADIAALLARRIGRRGHLARVAATGSSALAQAGAHPPDLVLLDLRLPDMDGWEVLDRLRDHEALAQVPVLVVSMVEEDLDDDHGVDAYVTKPFRSREIDAHVERLLAGRPERRASS